jgi:hypothetical protein
VATPYTIQHAPSRLNQSSSIPNPDCLLLIGNIAAVVGYPLHLHLAVASGLFSASGLVLGCVPAVVAREQTWK